MMEMFMGQDYKYWMELQKRVLPLNVDDLINDLARANAKVSYYEKLIERMYQYRTGVESLK